MEEEEDLLGPSMKGEHPVFCKLCQKEFLCAHSGQYDCRKHIKSQFHINIRECEGIFHQQRKTIQRRLKRQVTAADVKMCEMRVELNLPFATADSVTHILIGRELTNFHYYGFVVYTQFLLPGHCLEGCAHK